MLDSARQSKSRYSHIKRANDALRVALTEALVRERKAKTELDEIKQRNGMQEALTAEISETRMASEERGAPITVLMRMRKAGAVAAAAAAAAATRKRQRVYSSQKELRSARAPWRTGGGIERYGTKTLYKESKEQQQKARDARGRKSNNHRKGRAQDKATELSSTCQLQESEKEVEILRRRLALQVSISQGLQKQVEELIGELSI